MTGDAGTLVAADISVDVGPKTPLLSNITLEFEERGLVAIVGPNGAGKSVFVDVLSGFRRPTKGRVLFGKHVLSELSPERVARMGVVRSFQTPRLIPTFTVPELAALIRDETSWVEMRRRAGRGDGEIMGELLKTVGLSPRSNFKIAELSWGVRKLLGTACALAGNARVVLLDEPWSGVGVTARVALIDILKREAASRLILVVEHDHELVRQIASRVVVMARGRVIAVDTPDRAFESMTVLDVLGG